MPTYQPENMPDDPYRTADYGSLPGENEYETRDICKEDAVNRVIDALGQRGGRTLGMDGDGWEETLCSHYLVDKYRDLAIALLKGDQQTLVCIGDYLRDCVEKEVNDWRDKASCDELEAEGLIDRHEEDPDDWRERMSYG